MPLIEDFSPQLFVGRKKELDELNVWAIDSDSPRLMTIAAPPGYGKSWLLRQLEHRLSARRDLFLIWLSAEDFKLSPANPTDDITAKITSWRQNFVAKARYVCAQLRTLDLAAAQAYTIAQVVEEVCQNRHLILLVDGFDELFPNEARPLEKQVLEEFWRKECVRIVMAIREQGKLTSPTLRRGELRSDLNPFSQAEGDQQLAVRLEELQTPRSELIELVAPYTLQIPGLNTLLARQVRKNEQASRTPLLTSGDVEFCWRELIGESIKTVPHSWETLEQDLIKFGHHPVETWTVSDFVVICQVDSEREAREHIDSLQKLGVVAHVQHQRFAMVEGLRQLLCAYHRLKDEQNNSAPPKPEER